MATDEERKAADELGQTLSNWLSLVDMSDKRNWNITDLAEVLESSLRDHYAP